MKCSKCQADHPIQVMSMSEDGQVIVTCRDCLDDSAVADLREPPMGWPSEKTKSVVLTRYSIIQWEGKQN